MQQSKYQFDGKVPGHVVIAAYGIDKDGKPIDLPRTIREQQPVTLVVSLGPIPDVEGLSVENAIKALQIKDLNGSMSDGLHDWSDTVEKGKVIRVELPADGRAGHEGRRAPARRLRRQAAGHGAGCRRHDLGGGEAEAGGSRLQARTTTRPPTHSRSRP